MISSTLHLLYAWERSLSSQSWGKVHYLCVRICLSSCIKNQQVTDGSQLCWKFYFNYVCLLLDTVVHVPIVLIAAKSGDEFDVLLCGSQVASTSPEWIM